MAILQIRVDDDLKEEAAALYERLGLDLSTAIRIFLKKSVSESGIPFPMTVADIHEKAMKLVYECNRISEENGNANMTLDEINEEIRLAREEADKKRASKKQ